LDGNTSSLLIQIVLHLCDLPISSRILAVVETYSKATPCFISYGSTKNSP